jgi:hypothetical protein
MRQDIAYILTVAMVLGIAIWWRITLVRSRRGRRGSIKVDLFKKDEADR